MFASEDRAWTVEVVHYSSARRKRWHTDPDGAGSYYLVRFHGKVMGHARTPAEVAGLGCDLADLDEIPV